MNQSTANRNTIPPTTPPMIAAVGILAVFTLELVGVGVTVVVDTIPPTTPLVIAAVGILAVFKLESVGVGVTVVVDILD